MRYPRECYQLLTAMGEYFPSLRPAQQRGLALWVYGTVLAKSACQNAVIARLLIIGSLHAIRQYLREWLYDGQDKAAPCNTQVEITLCFGPLLRWVLSFWQGRDLALAVDATAHHDKVVSLVVSILYRGCAIPIAWHTLPANQKGAWMQHVLRLLRFMWRELPPTMRVLVMVDRGLWSRRLWKRIRDLGWHPLPRLQNTVTFQPVGQRRQVARELVPGPGHAWVGKGTVFRDRPRRVVGTLIVVWGESEEEPWVLLTDLPPDKVGVWWYRLRVWIELGFRALKGVGWQWEHARRTDPTRVTRHWLVLAVATIWVLAYGTRAEDADLRGLTPANLRKAPTQAVISNQAKNVDRPISVFTRGLTWFCHQLTHGRLWRHVWLAPEPWPDPPVGLQVTYHAPT